MTFIEDEIRHQKRVALVSSYVDDEGMVKRIEVSITYPKLRQIVNHRVWKWEDRDWNPDELSTDVIKFCEAHNADEVQVIDRPLPLSEASVERCRHCGGENVRVPWV